MSRMEWVHRTFPVTSGLEPLDWALLPFGLAFFFAMLSATVATVMHDQLGLYQEKVWTNDANLLGLLCTAAEQDRRLGRKVPSDPVMLAEPVDRPRLIEFRQLYPKLATKLCLAAKEDA